MIRLLAARFTRPLRWRNPRATARMLAAFARAERASHFDMMAAANATTDTARKALYVAHAVDEGRHARMFKQRALELEPSYALDPSLFRADFEHLFARLGEAQFIAFVYLGEQRGRAQLSMYRDELRSLASSTRQDAQTMAILDAVLLDEARHESYTRALASELRASLPKARLWQAGRGWLRAGSRVSELAFVVLMSLLYLALFPLALWEKARRS